MRSRLGRCSIRFIALAFYGFIACFNSKAPARRTFHWADILPDLKIPRVAGRRRKTRAQRRRSEFFIKVKLSRQTEETTHTDGRLFAFLIQIKIARLSEIPPPPNPPYLPTLGRPCKTAGSLWMRVDPARCPRHVIKACQLTAGLCVFGFSSPADTLTFRSFF